MCPRNATIRVKEDASALHGLASARRSQSVAPDPRGPEQEQWTPGGWIPNYSMAWTGIGGNADWDEISEYEVPGVIESLEAFNE